jgi:flagellar biosynthesis protein FlhG
MEAELKGSPAKKSRKKSICIVISGKGGSGKTFITANLGAALASQGRKVLLFDYNLTSPNLHSLFKKRTLVEGVAHSRLADDLIESLRVEQTDIANLLLVPANQPALVLNINRFYKADIIKIMQAFDVDIVLLDMPPGWRENIPYMSTSAARFIYVLEPTPFSIESFYNFIKHTLLERITGIYKNADNTIKEAIFCHSHQGMKDMFDIVEHIGEQSPEAAGQIREFLAGFRPLLLLNKSRSLDDRQTASTLCFLCKRHFAVEMEFLGSVDFDENIWQANKKKQLVVSELPLSVATKSIAGIASLVLELDSKKIQKAEQDE